MVTPVHQQMKSTLAFLDKKKFDFKVKGHKILTLNWNLEWTKAFNTLTDVVSQEW